MPKPAQLNSLVKEIVDSIPISSKLTPRRRIENPCTGEIHKYRRFSKKNKTYHTDRFYCADCGKTVKIEDSFGRQTKCWKCERIFSLGVGRTGLKPTCGNCETKTESIKRDIEKEIDEILEVFEK